MKRQIILIMCACCAGSVFAEPQNDKDAKHKEAAKHDKWILRWSDEFNGKELNQKNWSRCERGKSDWNNTMSQDPRLLKIENGILRLNGIVNVAREQDPAHYLTAGIVSKDKYAFKYGKVKIRARFKCAQGAWPALWMLGSEGKWPANGEIDLMEHLNFDRKVYQTIHSLYSRRPHKISPRRYTTVKIDPHVWNTYGCIWDENKIVFTVNDKATLKYPRIATADETQWPFMRPAYFILSMQIGGKWVGRARAKDYPAYLEVDWIRVYQSANAPKT